MAYCTVGTLADAGPEALSFFANPAYRPMLATTRAGAVILKPEDAESCAANCLLADDPYLLYARIARLFDARPRQAAGIHPNAQVDDSVELGEGIAIGPGVSIDAGCVLGDGVQIGPGCVVDGRLPRWRRHAAGGKRHLV